MVDVLSRRVQALASMAKQAGSIGLRVKVKKESTICHG